MDEPTGNSGFEWDQGNSEKNWVRHRVSQAECEQFFRNEPVVAASIIVSAEQRYFALGVTDSGGRLSIVYTVRGSLIRVISARDMSRRERRELL